MLRLFYFTIFLFLIACSPDKERIEIPSTFQPPNTGAATGLTDDDYFALDNISKYAVSNKLLATLYKGMPADDFFDFSKGASDPKLKINSNLIVTTLNSLNVEDPNYSQSISRANELYFTDLDGSERVSPLEKPLSYLYELPLSSEYFDMWMAYQLMNTILFSPATEIETVDSSDAEAVFSHLFTWMQADLSIREIVNLHMLTQENWRRFRSPEDNVREMMEIYLNRFNDTEVEQAAIACKNWHLSEQSLGYRLIKTVDINQQPLPLLERVDITTCEDFYLAVSQHIQLIPSVTLHVIQYLLPNSSSEKQIELSAAISNAKPTTFRDLFLLLLSSKAYLLEESKIKRFEEVLFNIAPRIYWVAHRRYFDVLNRNNAAAGAASTNLKQLNQRAMFYKLGRPMNVPVDTLSFAYYFRATRNALFLDQRETGDENNRSDGGWSATAFSANVDVRTLSDRDRIHYTFLSVLSRLATTEELITLEPLLANKFTVAKTSILFDYFSRLPELYTFKKIE